MEFDVVIVGGGPSGLAAAIRLRQLATEKDREVSVCVVDKGSEIGAHILSGAVFDPIALNELLPDWQQLDAPLNTPVTEDEFLYLSEKSAHRLPTPPQMKNHGNFVISLGNMARWLGSQAEALGAEVYAGFAAAEVLYDDDGRVTGVATGDMGLNEDGSPGPNHEPGIELLGTYTLFAEGCRGSLSKSLFEKFDLGRDSDPQTYGIGIKELWEIDPANHRPGRTMHSIGWPLDNRTYGGSFLYHLDNNQVAVGFVIGLDYENPHLSPFEEMQRFKSHPAIAPVFAGARRISYGARALNEGGWQSIPGLTFPGGALIGCAAGFLNVPRIKGSHTAMKSGMLAAEAAFSALGGEAPTPELTEYPKALRKSWLGRELKKARNIRPAFRWGLWAGIAYSAIDTYLFAGHAPWTLHHHADHLALKKASDAPKIDYPKPDGVLTFDKLSSVHVSNTNHAEGQPCHLRLKDAGLPLELNLVEYDGPEQRFCPAGVYEFIEQNDETVFRINSQNCIHCKTCDIKDMSQNIDWSVPEGGGGPNYPNM